MINKDSDNGQSTLDSGAWMNELTIQFEDGSEENFFIELTKSGTFVVPNKDAACDWTHLDFHKCPCCPLTSENDEYCPAAESIESTLLRLKDRYSYEKVTATVIDSAKRSTIVNWQLQEVGSTFVQLAVFSSSCPIGRQFKPLVRDLRPFSTNDELSKHLISKILLKHRGKMEECEQDIIGKMEPLRIVFSHLAKRLSGIMEGDAIANSIVRLDAFALNVSLLMEEVFGELTKDLGWKIESINPMDDQLSEITGEIDDSDPKGESKEDINQNPIIKVLSRIKTAFADKR